MAVRTLASTCARVSCAAGAVEIGLRDGRSEIKPYPDGEVRRQYWCKPRSVNGGCGRITVDQRELDRHVGALVVRILSDPRHAEAVEAAAKATADKRHPLLAELSECEHLADELSGRLGRREITLKRYDVVIVPLDRRIAELRAGLAALESLPRAIADPVAEAASREEWTARWNAATVAERRNLIRQALTNRRIVIAPVVRRPGFRSSTQSASSSRKCAMPNNRTTIAPLGDVAAA